MDLDGRGGKEKLGGVEGREIIIRIYCAIKKSIFNKRKKRWEDILMMIIGDCEMA